MTTDEMTMNYVIENFEVDMIVPVLHRVEDILKNFGFKQSQIRRIMVIGGLDLGGLKHLESRCFNYALALWVGDVEHYEHCINSLEELKKQMTTEEDPFEILERIIESD